MAGARENQQQKTGAFGPRITVPHLVVDTDDGTSLRVSALSTGHATMLDRPMTLSELKLAPVPEATADSQQTTTVPAGTTVTGDVYQRATSPSPGPEPAPAPQVAAEPQLDPAVAYQLHAGTVPVSTSRSLA